MLYPEFPIGTGFSKGPITITSEEDAAAQFIKFWKNFVDTFDLKGKKIYMAGESYAAYYVHYIADAMFNANDTNVSCTDHLSRHDSQLTYLVLQR